MFDFLGAPGLPGFSGLPGISGLFIIYFFKIQNFKINKFS